MIFLWGKMCLLYSLLGCPSKTKLLLHEVPEGSVLGPSMSPLFSVLHKRPLKEGHSVENYVYADETTNFCVVKN